MSFSFIPNPSGSAMSDQEFIARSLEQPMSIGATFWDQGKGGVLESFGLGTAIRESQLPDKAPTKPDLVITPPEGDGPVLVPDTPQMRRRMTAFEAVNGRSLQSRQEAPKELEARQKAAGALSEDAYKASPFYRQNIPWQNGMTEDRAAALAEQDDMRKVREFYAAKRPITAFFGNLGGQALDPINYIPVAGEAVAAANAARFGKVAGRALTGAIDAAGNTAGAALLTAPNRGSFGDDVSFQSTASQIAMAAIVGGAFGAAVGRFGRETAPDLRAEAETKLATLQNVQKARVALNDALDGMIRDGEVRVSQASGGIADEISQEVARLSSAYDNVLARPSGPVDDPLVRLSPGDIEDLIVSRGAFKDVNSVEFSKSGKGLLKVIWGHGDKSREPPEFQVSKDDVTALPQIIRDYEPIAEGLRKNANADSQMRTWRVERGGRILVYGDKGFDGGQHLVTVHVQKPNAPGADLPMSGKKIPAATGSSDEPIKPVGDTAQQPLPSSAGGQSLPADVNIAPSPRLDNGRPRFEPDMAVTAAEGRVGRLEADHGAAEQFRVNPETGEFAEQADIDQLIAEGRLSAEDLALLEEADATLKSANAYGEAVKAFANCVI